ncbi:MAG: amino acid adenylation domain-containing protein, partial [Bacteroidales bacterium]|nr:amino acid adenylation domain-containing protein [Bacteroidales bacterium]
HSLKATVLTSKIHKELGIEFPLRDVFLHTTIKSQASQIEISTKKDFVSITKAKEQSNYPLSPGQKRLYLLQQFDLTSTAYNMPGIISLAKEVNKSKIKEVFKQLINRHESFRTSIIVVDSEPVQLISKDIEFDLEELRIESTEVENTRNKFIKPFDLSKAPFLRAVIVDVKGEDSLLMLDMHHIISDGISHTILEKEFYALLLGKELAPLPLQYKDYSQWQNSNEQQEFIKDQEKYWLTKFEGEIPVLNLPTDYARPLVQSHEGATVGFVLSKEETEGIKSFTKENDLTLYMSLLSVFSILLSKLSGQDDIIIGTPIAGRNHTDLENIVGMFVNTLSIRNEVKKEETIQEFVSSLKQTVLGAYENQNYQFEDLVDKVSAERDTSRNPIFDVVINLLNQAEHRGNLSGFNNQEQVHEIGISKFDLTLTAEDFGDQLMLSFEYCTQLFKAETIDKFIAYFKRIVTQIAKYSERKLSELEIISVEEKQQILYTFNDTQVSYPIQKSIARVFNEQVKSFSKKIALEDKDKSYTYQDLDEESNKIANYLIKRGVTEDQLVGLMAGRSSEMIIGILGILKTGGGYVPIDPAYPKERVNQLIDDSGINILLSTEAIDFECNLSGGIINISDLEIKESSADLSLPSISSSNIAYVMYTSGSTGTPKGVVIEQKSVLRLVQNNQFFPFHSEQKILLTGALVFDATTFEIWGALLNGGSLYIASNEVIINPELLGECIRKNSITSLWLTSSLFNQLVDQDESIFDTLKFLLVGGDVLSVKHINKIKTRNSELVIINGYGPTENTTFSTTLKIEKQYESNIPIGKPISNSTAYIFDKSNRLQAVGVPGELLVGGDGLAREYLNNQELTREKFIENPYKEGERLYKTGDLARCLPDGNIEFLGRIDQQVKIRGFRIELGEIESTLLKHDNIKQSVVLAIEKNNDIYLCAYVVCKEGFSDEELRAYISEQLPEYMVPSYFVELESLPLNANGKVNRKVLPLPEIKAGDDYVAPSTEIEAKLLEIWSEVLNIEKEDISVNANFFSIGGHSLKATILTGKIYKEIGVEFPLREVFVHPTIKSQASQIVISTKKEFVSIPKAKEQSNYPLSPAQKRMYLLQQFDLTSTAYNMPGIIPLGKEVDQSKIEEVFQELIIRHDSFRTSFELERENPVQIINKEVGFKIEKYSIDKSEENEMHNRFVKPFDLSRAPLLRVAIVEIRGERSLLMIDIHHIISDGVSQTILEKEFQALYSGEVLPALSLQFKDYAVWQDQLLKNIEYDKKVRNFWRENIGDGFPEIKLPYDFNIKTGNNYSSEYQFYINDSTLLPLRDLANKQSTSLFTVVYSVFNILLSYLTGKEDVYCSVINSGRTINQVQELVGCFANSVLIKNNLNSKKNILELIADNHTGFMDIHGFQDFYYEEILEEKGIKYPEVPVAFNMLNFTENTESFSGNDSHNHRANIGRAKFDIELYVNEYENGLSINWIYNNSLFKPETIEYIASRYNGLLESIVKGADNLENLKIREVKKEIPQQETNKISLSNRYLEFEKEIETSIITRFESQVAEYGEKTAIVYKDETYSYLDLDRESNQIANTIISGKSTNNEGVALLFEQGTGMIKSMLGVLKSGNYYIPLDVTYPINRLKFILKDSGARTILTNEKNKQLAIGLQKELGREIRIINITSDCKDLSTSSPNINILPDTLAYVLYTSGSTGKPKGVIQNHRNVLHFLRTYTNNLHINNDDKLSLFSSYGFDSAVQDIYGALLNGASVHVYDIKQEGENSRIQNWMLEEGISIYHVTPTVYRYLVSNLETEECLDKVRIVVLGGEAVYKKDFNEYKKHFNEECIFINGLGSTESTLTLQNILNKSSEISRESVPVGFGVTDTEVYLEKPDKSLALPYEEGEIIIKSKHLALAYLNSPEKTHESFVKEENKVCILKTGDLGRHLADNSIEYIGRKDFQIKIRGNRVELGEVEGLLDRFPGISKSIVKYFKQAEGDGELVSYYVPNDEAHIEKEELKKYIELQVPSYMVPMYYIQLEEFPYTLTGKIDRKALPSPEVQVGDNYAAPSNEIEENLLGIWSEVLNTEKEYISVNSNFLDIGGNSFRALVLMSKIHKATNVEIPLKDIFVHTSIKAQAIQIKISTKKEFVSIPKAKEQPNYPLSSAQKRLYLLQQFDLTSTAYNMPKLIPLGKKVDKSKIEDVFKQLINRHENFRTSFIITDGEPVQLISKKVEFELEELSIENTEIENTRNKFIKPFDLSQAPLLRVAIVDIKGEDNLLIDMHHIISDGTSHTILQKEFQALLSGEELSPLPLQYKDYSQWQNSKEQQERVKDQEEYWITKFEGEIPVLNLPSDYVRPLIQSHEGAAVNFILSKEETEGIKLFTKENDLTLYMSLLSVFSILLSKLSGQDDVIVGTPIAGRNHADLENIVGIFVNTLSIRNEVKGEETIQEFVSDLKQTVLGAYENQNYQFEDLVNKVSVERDASRNPIFDVMFNLLNQAEYREDISGFNNQEQVHKTGMSKFDLTLTSLDYGEQLMLRFEYCTQLFKAETINRFIEYFKQIVVQLARKPEIKISAIDILTEEERHQLLYEFNNTKADYPEDKTIHQLFKEQVLRTPEGIALVYNNTELTYQELNQRSNQLSHFLVSKGLKPGNIVSIMLDRSIEMIVGILSVLKAGGVYCPIDINNPVERKKYILEDNKSRLLLTKNSLLGDLDYDGEIVYADDFTILPKGNDNIRLIGTSEELAYLIYTSGTTGKPKGVMIRHDGVVNTISWYAQRYRLSPGERLLQLSNYSFDASVNQIFGTLTGGASLYIIEENELLDLSSLYSYLGTHKITIINSVPAILEELISNRQRLPFLQRIISGGEKLSNQLKDKIINLGYELHNHYGPTEGTIVVLAEKCSERNVSLGKPKQNTQSYILSGSYDQLQPIGVKGELCISGEGISPGYLNNESLTKEKFISHPFKEGERLYCTGDLARCLPDGNIEFLGRIDHQVKIRGFRIELGEIESILLKHENIKESVVLAREENGDKYLCAYIVSKEGFSQEELRAYLLVQLPEYMIPSYIVGLESLPLNPNGKINRKALPSPQIKAGDDYVAPSTEIEEKLVKIWSEVLNIENEEISTNVNFFSIGGHSLKATILTGKIFKEIGVEFPLRDVFLHSTIKSQASQIETSTKKDFVSIPKAKEQSNYPVSSAQKRLYLLQQFDLTSTVYNMSNLIPLGKEADKSKIEEVFKQLINRHESFRTSINIVDQVPVQLISKHVEFELGELSIENTELENTRINFIKPFDLSQPPFLRAAIVDIKGEDSLLMIDMHHIISDGTSHVILEQEFQAMLSGEELAPLPLQYKDYSQWQYSSEQQEFIKNQEQYWLNKFEEEIPILNLPIDYVRPLMQNHEGARVRFVLSKEETEGIRFLTKENDLTLYMSLLSVFSILLSKLSRQEDIVVGTPIAGRNHADLENIVGIFVNTLSIRNEVRGEETIQEFVSNLKQTVLGAYENQNYQFEDLVDKISVDRDTSRNPIFDVMFNLLNQAEYKSSVNVDVDNSHKKGISKFDLNLTAIEFDNSIFLNLEYCTRLFKKETIDRFIVYFKKIVSQIARNSELKISAIDILSKEEKHQLLYEFNNTKADYPKDKTIHQLFEEQVNKIPDNIAIICGDEQLTYEELNKRSEQLASSLAYNGIVSGDKVGLILERSLEMLIGIFGILKAGGVYVPIDPTFPENRIKYIIDSSESKLVLSERIYNHNNKEYPIPFIFFEDIDFSNNKVSEYKPKIVSGDLSYIIYTSGSTGNPKGVQVEHRSLTNLLYFLQDQYPITIKDSYLLKTSYCFDVSISEIFGWILGGGSLSILGKDQEKDSSKIIDAILKHKITHINFVPTALKSFSQSLTVIDQVRLKSLKFLLIAGEALYQDHLQEFNKLNLDIHIANLYGPTEATVYTSHYKVIPETLETVSIGKPISNYSIFILDNRNKLQPIGIPGELCISGIGLARGYMGNPTLSSEKFIDHPFNEGERLYRTGDLARWLPDGNIEFSGRLDHQVKIRGFRIELGEIENTLLKHERINECLVLAREENEDKYLCAYILSKEELNHEELRTYMSAQLPDYMVPSYFVQLNELPLTSNGKVNRKALPAPEIKAGDDYIAPSTKIEESLLEIWSEVLKVPKEEISTTTSFFAIGGHSLKATILVSKIHKELSVKLPLNEVFQQQTIKKMAVCISKVSKISYSSINLAEKKEYHTLSSAQKRLYFIQQMDFQSISYNMPMV